MELGEALNTIAQGREIDYIHPAVEPRIFWFATFVCQDGLLARSFISILCYGCDLCLFCGCCFCAGERTEVA